MREPKGSKEEITKKSSPTLLKNGNQKKKREISNRKKDKVVILGYAPSIINLSTTNDKLAMDIVNDDRLEKDSTKYLATADIFYQENIELRDLNGNIIPANTADVCYMLEV